MLHIFRLQPVLVAFLLLGLCGVFLGLLFVLFYFWPLRYLSFDLTLLIATLVSSIFSWSNIDIIQLGPVYFV